MTLELAQMLIRSLSERLQATLKNVHCYITIHGHQVLLVILASGTGGHLSLLKMIGVMCRRRVTVYLAISRQLTDNCKRLLLVGYSWEMQRNSVG